MVASGLRFIAVLAVAVIAATGCASAVPTASSTVTPRPTSTPTPTPSKPTLSQLVVSPDGLGYLVAGRPVPAEPVSTAIASYNATKCVNAVGGVAAGSPGSGAWIPNYPAGDASSVGGGLPFDVGPVDGPADPIHVIEIWSPELKTAKGIGVGSTTAQLTAAYASTLSVDSADNSDVYVLAGASTKLLFEVAKEASGLAPNQIGTVVWMRIVPLDNTGLHIANTDAAGPCSA